MRNVLVSIAVSLSLVTSLFAQTGPRLKITTGYGSNLDKKIAPYCEPSDLEQRLDETPAAKTEKKDPAKSGGGKKPKNR